MCWIVKWFVRYSWNAGTAQDPIVDSITAGVITLCGKMLTMQLEASSRGECHRVLRGVPAMMDNRFSRGHVSYGLLAAAVPPRGLEIPARFRVWDTSP